MLKQPDKTLKSAWYLYKIHHSTSVKRSAVSLVFHKYSYPISLLIKYTKWIYLFSKLFLLYFQILLLLEIFLSYLVFHLIVHSLVQSRKNKFKQNRYTNHKRLDIIVDPFINWVNINLTCKVLCHGLTFDFKFWRLAFSLLVRLS